MYSTLKRWANSASMVLIYLKIIRGGASSGATTRSRSEVDGHPGEDFRVVQHTCASGCSGKPAWLHHCAHIGDLLRESRIHWLLKFAPDVFIHSNTI